MMRVKIQQHRRPLPNGMNAAGRLERRALRRNIGLSSSVILLLRCLFAGIVVYSGWLAASASEAPIRVSTGSANIETRECQAVITPTRNRFSWRNTFNRWTEDRLLVSPGFRVIRLSCYFHKMTVFMLEDTEKCHERAKSACGRAPLGSMVFEVSEFEVEWITSKAAMLRNLLTIDKLIPSFIFVVCQVPRNVDERRDKCQGGKRMRYYNALFDSYRHAWLHPVHYDMDRYPYNDETAIRNIFAGRVFLTWDNNVIADCEDDVPRGYWKGLRTQNSSPPRLVHQDELGESELGTQCDLKGREPGQSFSYSYLALDDYRDQIHTQKSRAVEVKSHLKLQKLRIPVILPLTLPDLGEQQSVKIVHIRLRDYSILPNNKKIRMPLKDRASKITTISCRTGARHRSFTKCLAKVQEDIEEADSIFVSTKRYRLLSYFVENLVPALCPASMAEKLARYRFVIEGSTEFLGGITPRNPSSQDQPVPVDNKYLPLITAPFKLALWPSYSKVDWTVHEFVYDNLDYRDAPDTAHLCVGEMSVTFNSSQWTLRTGEEEFEPNIEQERAVLKFHPTRPQFLNHQQMVDKDTPVYLARKKNQDREINLIHLSCACPFGGSEFMNLTLTGLSISFIIIRKNSKLELSSTVMFHVLPQKHK